MDVLERELDSGSSKRFKQDEEVTSELKMPRPEAKMLMDRVLKQREYESEDELEEVWTLLTPSSPSSSVC